MANNQIPTPNIAGDSRLAWLAAFVFAVTVGALLFLEANHLDDTALLLIVGPVVTALLVSGQVANRVTQVTEEQNVKLEQISEQTNGVLDERIHAQAIKALLDHDDLIRDRVIAAIDVMDLPQVVKDAAVDAHDTRAARRAVADEEAAPD